MTVAQSDENFVRANHLPKKSGGNFLQPEKIADLRAHNNYGNSAGKPGDNGKRNEFDERNRFACDEHDQNDASHEGASHKHFGPTRTMRHHDRREQRHEGAGRSPICTREPANAEIKSPPMMGRENSDFRFKSRGQSPAPSKAGSATMPTSNLRRHRQKTFAPNNLSAHETIFGTE